MSEPITEDFVSFETAKLLKEKGFDERVKSYYTESGLEGYMLALKATKNTELGSGFIACPTLQMAMKWLREVHKIFIDVDFDTIEFGDEPYYTIITDMSTCSYITGRPALGYKTYEEAAESAIKYCLENLV